MNDPCDDQVPDSVSGRLRRPRMIVAGLVVALVSSAAALREAAADLFTLENGEQLEGTIVHATRNTIIIRRDIGGIRQVRAEDLTEDRDHRQRRRTAGRPALGLGGWRLRARFE